jgi:hypothetical protein
MIKIKVTINKDLLLVSKFYLYKYRLLEMGISSPQSEDGEGHPPNRRPR